MELATVEKILGGRRTLNKHLENDMDLIELCKIGVSKKALLNLASYLDLSMHQISSWLPVTERTIQRYSSATRFKKSVSEQILYIAKVVAKGVEVFEDKEKFLFWLKLPNKVLGNKTPCSLLDTKLGVDIVLEELGRIEHGIFA